jgi:lipopolysaccharide transport protein LptA|tara:strand:- start:728 stop:1252 length:525 start_codon:yes stop_codon:yes gene_type:complete
MSQFNQVKTKLALVLISLGALGFLLSSHGAENLPVDWNLDGELSVTIEGDRRIVNMADNVRVTQGSLLITGDTAVFEYTIDTEELVRITMHGTPVEYQQRLGDDEGSVIGNSDTLILYSDKLTDDSIVEMIGNAFIQSPTSTMKCATITYVTERDLIREAEGPCEGALSSAPGQ